MQRSTCPVTGHQDDCTTGCEWFIDPDALVPKGGCVLVLLFRELLGLRMPRKKDRA